ncbi:MAG: hypothetical protein LBI19_01465 [Oscillospiraceae bacterium]|jgi:hypothetical protein|nr:hypothetical protein [Oscillospiraceae bacterium]
MKNRHIIFALALALLAGVLAGCGGNAPPAESPNNEMPTVTPAENLSPELPSMPSPLPNPIEETDPYGNSLAWTGNEPGNFPLYAMLPDDDIYLYGVLPYGMVLYQNGKGTYFDWPGLMPRRVLPQMMYNDFDGDGAKDLAVTLLIGSGTGFHVMDLHILTIGGTVNDWYEPIYTDHVLAAANVSEWMAEPITATLTDDGNSIILDFLGKNFEVVYNAYSDSGSFTGISYGDIVHFVFEDNRIKTSIALGFTCENYTTPDFIGDIEAYVVFDGVNFNLEEYTFTLYPNR